jgi:TatD DNase family protein
MTIDSHCHLDLLPDAEVPDIIGRAHAAGVPEMVTIGTTLPQSRSLLQLAEAWDRIWCSVGVHPQQVDANDIAAVDAITALVDHPKVIGIGETGLDYHYQTAPAPAQQQSFRNHIAAARRASLPVIVHARAADDDVAAMLEEETAAGSFSFLLHCFSSGLKLAERARDLGGYFSFSGILTFPKSGELREIARRLPPDRLLVETDAPYLAPAPYRGRRNEPAFVQHTLAALAELHGSTAAEMEALTTANFRRLFTRSAA